MSGQWENEIVKRVYRNTHDEVKCYRCGYSGSNAFPQPDILITNAVGNHGVELKGPIASDQCRVENDDAEQLVACRGPQTNVYLGIKFQNRAPVMVKYYHRVPQIDGYSEMTAAEKFAELAHDAFNPHVTDSGTLVLDKPDTDEWESARASPPDYECIARGVGVTAFTDDEKE